MFTVFFDICGTVHHEYILERQTVTREYYQQVLHLSHDAVGRKRLGPWMMKNRQLHVDNETILQLVHRT